MKVFKYSLSRSRGEQKVLMPVGVTLLSCGLQDGVVVVWALVNPALEKKMRTIAVVWTGEDVPDHWAFVGTVQNPETGIVSHVFDRGFLGDAQS